MARFGEDVLEWNPERIAQWLCEEGMNDCVKIFTAKKLNGRNLVTLSDTDIKSLHISHESKKKLIKSVEKYRTKRKNITQRMFKDANVDVQIARVQPTRKPSSFSHEDDDDADDDGWGSDEFDTDAADDESSSDDAGEYLEPEHDESLAGRKEVASVPTGLVAQLRAGIAQSLGRGAALRPPIHGAVKATPNVDDEDEDDDAIYDLPPEEEELYEEPSDSSGGAIVVRPPSSSKIIRTCESAPAGEYIEARPRKLSDEDVLQETYEQPIEGGDMSFSSHGSRPFIPTKVEQNTPRQLVKQPSEEMYEVPQPDEPEDQYEVPEGQTGAPPPPRPPKHPGPQGPPPPVANGRQLPRGQPSPSQQTIGNRPSLPSHATSPGQRTHPGTSPSQGSRPLQANRAPPPGPSVAKTPPQGPTPTKRVPLPPQGAKPSLTSKGPTLHNKGPLPPEPAPATRAPARVPDGPSGRPNEPSPGKPQPMNGRSLPAKPGVGLGPAKPPRVEDGAPELPLSSPARRPPLETKKPLPRAPESTPEDAPPPRPPKQGHPPERKQTPPPKHPQPTPQSHISPPSKQPTPSKTSQPQPQLRKQTPPPPSHSQVPLPTPPEATPPRAGPTQPPKHSPAPPGKRGPLPTPNQGHTPPPAQQPSLPRKDITPSPRHPLPQKKVSVEKKGVPLPAPPTFSSPSRDQSSASSIESGSADDPIIPLHHLETHSKKRSLPPPPSSAPLPPKPKTPLDIMKEAPWFQGPVDRKKTETTLKACKKDGAFLVRNSTRSPNDFSMSLFFKGDVRHLKIPIKDGKYALGASGTQRFDSIIELVNFYRQNNIDLKAGGTTKLTIPCQVYS